MNYQIQITRRASKSLGRLPNRDYERIRDAIRKLNNNPRPSGSTKLIGREGWRIRIGRYRVLYDIDDVARVLVVLDIGHRREIYR